MQFVLVKVKVKIHRRTSSSGSVSTNVVNLVCPTSSLAPLPTDSGIFDPSNSVDGEHSRDGEHSLTATCDADFLTRRRRVEVCQPMW